MNTFWSYQSKRSPAMWSHDDRMSIYLTGQPHYSSIINCSHCRVAGGSSSRREPQTSRSVLLAGCAMNTSWWHPYQMTKPPQLNPFYAKEQCSFLSRWSHFWLISLLTLSLWEKPTTLLKNKFWSLIFLILSFHSWSSVHDYEPWKLCFHRAVLYRRVCTLYEPFLWSSPTCWIKVYLTL